MITYHPDLIQGSDEWLEARRGIITASEMHLLLTPPPKDETRVKKNGAPYKQREWNPFADNADCRSHIYELAAQRISGHVEPCYISDDMLRGQEEELLARELYAKEFSPVTQVGFVTNDEWGFTLGYSPDGLVGEDGLIEAKSRRQKYQVETIIGGKMPDEFALQVQTGLLVTRREWLDFISYSGGLPMFIVRVYPESRFQDAIIEAATKAEEQIAEKMFQYKLASEAMIETPRTKREEMFV